MFVAEDDRDGYVALLATYARKHGVDFHAWCLMSNHVHLVVRGREQRSVALAVGNAHGKYAQWLNGRHGLSGHVWANRYYSTPLDLEHLIAGVRYVELNPVRAGLVSRAEDWPWSSARAHVLGCADPLLTGENSLAAHVEVPPRGRFGFKPGCGSGKWGRQMGTCNISFAFGGCGVMVELCRDLHGWLLRASRITSRIERIASWPLYANEADRVSRWTRLTSQRICWDEREWAG